jgi:T5SS/PEP-CTERM-associated repeat protein
MRKFVRPGRRERAIGNNHRNRVCALVSSTALVAVSTLFAPAMPAQAQTNWTGLTSTNWFTGSNWNTFVVPIAGIVTLDTVNPRPTVIGFAGASAQIVFVGNQGTGQLTIQGGGTLSSSVGVVGALAGSQGTVTVTGAGSLWFTSSAFVVGALGSGTLTIENGGNVISGISTIGRLTGAQGPGVGTVTVTGAGSRWDTGGLTVGDQGIGTLTISDGGFVTSTGGAIGNSGPQGAGQGTVTVTGATGAGSRWFIFGSLGIGNVGSTGTLTIADGGAVSNVEGIIGVGPGGSQGTVTVTGAGSTKFRLRHRRRHRHAHHRGRRNRRERRHGASSRGVEHRRRPG